MDRATFENMWFSTFAPQLTPDERYEIQEHEFLWHVFSCYMVPGKILEGQDAMAAYDKADKEGAISIWLPIKTLEKELKVNPTTAALPDSLKKSENATMKQELYIVAKDWSWTFVSTHENGWLGPYFYRIDESVKAFHLVSESSYPFRIKKKEISRNKNNGKDE